MASNKANNHTIYTDDFGNNDISDEHRHACRHDDGYDDVYEQPTEPGVGRVRFFHNDRLRNFGAFFLSNR